MKVKSKRKKNSNSNKTEKEMKFIINTEQFSAFLRPAADIALKNNVKEFKFAGTITLEAHPNALHIKGYGGTASIIVKVRRAKGYIPEEYGAATVTHTHKISRKNQ